MEVAVKLALLEYIYQYVCMCTISRVFNISVKLVWRGIGQVYHWLHDYKHSCIALLLCSWYQGGGLEPKVACVGAQGGMFGAQGGMFGAQGGMFGSPWWHVWEPKVACLEPKVAYLQADTYSAVQQIRTQLDNNSKPKVACLKPKVAWFKPKVAWWLLILLSCKLVCKSCGNILSPRWFVCADTSQL